MNKIGNHRLALSALLAILPLAATRAAEPPAPVKVEDAIHLTTKIEAVDQEKRTITVKDKDGKPVELEVSPEVKNLPQVKAGDTMSIVYYQSLAAEFKKPGEGVKGVQQDAVAGRAAEGERPAAGAGQQTRATVKIDSVDAATNTVKFTGPKGKQRTVAVKDPNAQAFIKQLKPGDEVELTYTEAVAISVDPTAK
jgi:hypothetical protein